MMGAIMGWYMQLWLSREGRKKLKEENRQMKHKMHVLSCVEQIQFMAGVVKRRKGTHDVLFSEDCIYEWAKGAEYEEYAQAALQLLKEKGVAEESKTTPSQYYIDRPKF
jgi:predicted metal-dependent HD superfamily phosphohydrolase